MKIQRLLHFLFILLLTSSSLTAKTYKIATLQDYYPYSKINEDGEASGIIVDWWKEWSLVSGVSVVFIPLDSELIKEQLETGAVDILSGVFYSEERTGYLSFCDPIIRLQTALYAKTDLPFDSIRFAAVNKGSVASEYLKKNYPELRLKEVTSLSLLREDIEFNQVDAFVYEIPNPIGNYKGMDDPEGYSKYEILFADKLRPAVKLNNTKVMDDVVLGANKIGNEKLIEIAHRYKMYEPVSNTWKVVSIVSIFSLLIIVILLITIRKQKFKVKDLLKFENNTDWQVILDKGENDLIEFKSSLRWDYRQEKPNKALEMVIVKTLSAFLNTQGGMLFIGVDDEGKSLGLENDYNSFSKGNRDGFMLALTNLVNQHVGKNIHQFLTINIISINEKDVCIINIDKSDKPVFFGKGDKEEFYIRTSAASQPLGIRESYEYIKSHWE